MAHLINTETGQINIPGSTERLVPHMELSAFREMKIAQSSKPMTYENRLTTYIVGPFEVENDLTCLVSLFFCSDTLEGVDISPTKKSKPPTWLERKLMLFFDPDVPSREEALATLRRWAALSLGDGFTDPTLYFAWGTVSLIDDTIRIGVYFNIQYKS